ncbi:MAG: aminotransferase class V-fold PLP-dependent enzyme, partial [Lachnospiraceae bacterium]|nr:aminotransferase class V-fold PLP-dependent enzyme [Lachnospiraceae bacterium]
MIYFDNAASTKTAPEAAEAMQRFFGEEYANPAGSSTASAGARHAVEEARESVAALIGAYADEIVFTSGGTESNNTAVFAMPGASEVICSAIEHPSVIRCVEALHRSGTRTKLIPCPRGIADTSALEAGMSGLSADPVRLRPESAESAGDAAASRSCRGIVSVMLVNNELGTLQPVAEIAEISHKAGFMFHTDAVQAAGHFPVKVHELGADMLS